MTLLRNLHWLYCFFAIFLFNKSFAQAKDLTIQENKVANLYANLLRSLDDASDSSDMYSEKFDKAFASLIKDNPTSLHYPFKKLLDSNYCFINTSNDGNFRIYSWDTWTGGTMHIFKTIYQWSSNGKVYSKVPKYPEDDAGAFYSKIFTVSIN